MITQEQLIAHVALPEDLPLICGGQETCRDYAGALEPTDPAQADKLVSNVRADILLANTFQDIADAEPDTYRGTIAREAADIAIRRLSVRIGGENYRSRTHEPVPPTVSPEPDPTAVLYAFDKKITQACRNSVRKKRIDLASEATGAQEAVLSQEAAMPAAPKRWTAHNAFRGLCAYLYGKKHTPISYYEQSVRDQQQLQKAVKACQSGHLPAHTAEEMTLLKETLEAKEEMQRGIDKVETTALLTRIEQGDIPVTGSPIKMLHQRGAAAIVRLFIGDTSLDIPTAGHAAFLTALQ